METGAKARVKYKKIPNLEFAVSHNDGLHIKNKNSA